MCRSIEPTALSSPAPSPETGAPPPHETSSHRDRADSPAESVPDPASVLDAYRAALVRVFLAAIDGLARGPARGVSGRAVANFLRGNQHPPASLRDASLLKLFGVLAGCPVRFVEETVRRLIDSGEVEEAGSPAAGLPAAGLPAAGLPAVGSSSRAASPGRIRLSRWGRDLLGGSGPVPIDVLPRPPCLGANPKLETDLWDLRRRLAEKEERAPFSIFSNSTLAALAAARPCDLGELAAVPGFGEARVRRYGDAVLAVTRGEE